MPTKTEYREYISSPEWRQRRQKFLEKDTPCNRCGLPRWLAIVAYDQDLHVHHRSYARVGAELDDDLEPLCKRCHEIETFGTSELHEVRAVNCSWCEQNLTWDLQQRLCDYCRTIRSSFDAPLLAIHWDDDPGIWESMAHVVYEAACHQLGFKKGTLHLLNYIEKIGPKMRRLG